MCYRKQGHNELDQPMFTQPQMYTAIGQMTPVFKKYAAQLIAAGAADQAEVDALSTMVLGEMEARLDDSKTYVPSKGDWLASNWAGMLPPTQVAALQDTGVSLETLKDIGGQITTLPADFNPHRMVGKVYAARKAMIESGEGIDWALGEQLAWATLLKEGNHVRISGQDSGRGTFSHRHCVVHDQKAFGHKHAPLKHIEGAAEFNACNSSLSEFAVLGFELGYSLENPASLVMWEAQFGDFANTAQS